MRDLIPVLSPDQACEWLLAHDAMLLDMRSDTEFHHLHIAGSAHMPATQLNDADMPAFPHERVILACQDGRQSQQIYRLLQRRLSQQPDLLIQLHVLDGGIAAWQDRGLPVVYNAGRHLSVDRQLSIGLGVVLLLGLLFGAILSWVWLLLPIAIGLLLIHKGVTGAHHLTPWLLALPWNKNKS